MGIIWMLFNLDSSPSTQIGLHAHKVRLVFVPGGSVCLPTTPSAAEPPTLKPVAAFLMTRSEIEVQTFCQFLTRFPHHISPYLDQVTQCRGQVRPLPGFSRKPVTEVSLTDAVLFCQWFSEVSGRRCRLPTPAEWIHMAGSGHGGNPYPWGWDPPSGRACFRQPGPKATGFFASSGYGLVDVTGNVYEWSFDPIEKKAWVHGGAWSDRHEFALHLQNFYEQPPAYRSADIGFRVLVETAATGSSHP